MLSQLLKAIFGNQEAAPALHAPTCPQCRTPIARLDKTAGSAWCGECNGLWLEQSVFSGLLQADAERLDAALLDMTAGDCDHTFAPTDRRPCAVCDELMDNYQFSYQSGIYIDGCPKAHGIWLDGGELALIRQWRDQGSPVTTPTKTNRTDDVDPRARAAMASLDAMTQATREAIRFREQLDAERQRQDPHRHWH